MAETLELEEYRKFTTPSELHKAVNTLKGIVAGITTDAETSPDEIQELLHWCTLHQHLRHRHPFSELLPMVETVYDDGIVTDDEAKDIIWLCNNFVSDATYYDVITSSIQMLSGLIHGIMADGALSDKEIRSLSTWLDANDYLRGCYPFDEIESLVVSALADGIIDESERRMLMAFFSNFVDLKSSYNLREPELAAMREQFSVDGICAVCPEVEFDSKNFCFTGESHRAKRSDISNLIEDLGGKLTSGVTKKTDFLIVGNAGNPCWAYACYGRKIEEAVKLRKIGCKVQIVNENDFWDAVNDAL